MDEINTCNSLGLITEIMCHHSYLGKKIDDNIIFLGACNPYRILTKKMKKSGLVYYNMKEKNILNNLVYTVNPLPHSLLNFVFDFASLQPDDEKKYINNTITSILSRFEREKLINSINESQYKSLKNEIIESINICHNFIREKYDQSSVSLREISRFSIFFEYFIKYFKKFDSSFQRIHYSLNISLYICYYLRLNDKGYRKLLCENLKEFYAESNFKTMPEKEIEYIANQMVIEKEKGIALNRALKENLFTCFISIVNNIPLIIVGKPGTGKSLSFQILFNSMKGKHSENKLFKEIGKLYRFYYQGSETSTVKGIKQVFEKARKIIKYKINKNSNENEVANFLKKELKFSENSIKLLNADGKKLLSLEENEIDKIELKTEEKDELKKYLKNIQNNQNNKIIEGIKEDNNIILSDSIGRKNEQNELKDKYKNDEQNIPLVFFDEMGLAERSSNNPLKIIHFELEKDEKDSVRFIGISNWRLDAAKINRVLNLNITDYDDEDLKDTAVAIAKALNINLSDKYKEFFETLAITYDIYIKIRQNSINENRDFHGNRDFYNLIKIAMKELIERKNDIINENKILTLVGNISLDRNFGGLEDSSKKIKEIFKNELGYKYDTDIGLESKFSILEAIKKNILDSTSRYLMLISEDNDAHIFEKNNQKDLKINNKYNIKKEELAKEL